VRPFLLDVSVLLALNWPYHEAHARILNWFRREGEKSFALCPLTEAGFVRVMTNPAFSGKRIEVFEAREALTGLARLKGYKFWPLRLSFAEAIAPFEQRVLSHGQVTDAFLLGLAIEQKGSLATLDRAIRHLAGSEFMQHVTLIES
jgi:uncharacterized protein